MAGVALAHIICFKRITYSSTPQPELWITESSYEGRKIWTPIETFLGNLQLSNGSYRISQIDPNSGSTLGARRCTCTTPSHFTTATASSSTPTYNPNNPFDNKLVQACWGRSAHRFSQGDPTASTAIPTEAPSDGSHPNFVRGIMTTKSDSPSSPVRTPADHVMALDFQQLDSS